MVEGLTPYEEQRAEGYANLFNKYDHNTAARLYEDAVQFDARHLNRDAQNRIQGRVAELTKDGINGSHIEVGKELGVGNVDSVKIVHREPARDGDILDGIAHALNVDKKDETQVLTHENEVQAEDARKRFGGVSNAELDPLAAALQNMSAADIYPPGALQQTDAFATQLQRQIDEQSRNQPGYRYIKMR